MASKKEGGKVLKPAGNKRKRGKAKKSSISKSNKYYVKSYRGQGR